LASGRRTGPITTNTTAPDSLYQKQLARAHQLLLPGVGRRVARHNPCRSVIPTPRRERVRDRTTFTQREYRERDLIADLDFRGDGWLWLDVQRPQRNQPVPHR